MTYLNMASSFNTDSVNRKALGLGLDLMKSRALETSLAYKHSLHSPHPAPALPSFDPETAHKLEEVSEDYAEDIHRFARMLNTLGKTVKNDADSSMALHLYDRTLL